MASRQEEKERRRREREEAERAAQAREARRKRLGIVLGGALAAAVVAILLIAFVFGPDKGNNQTTAAGSVPPPQQIEDLDDAAQAAGCRVATHKSEGRAHSSEEQEYQTNPPTSGTHDPTAAREGIYGPGNPPDVGQSIHALEHGRVNIQYRKGSPQKRINQLEQLFEEEVQGIPGFKTLVFENQTNMEPAVAATAWTRSITCPEWNDRVFDAIRAFRRDAVGKGPEPIPSEFEQ